MTEKSHSPSPEARRSLRRRSFLIGAGAAVVGGTLGKRIYDANEAFFRESVCIAKADSYTANLKDILRRGLAELGIERGWAKGKSVLVKPNLVEPTVDAPHINTHPQLVRAVVDVLRGFDAREVFVAEGPGHCRDTYLVLEQSGLGDVLDEAQIEFVDLNHDEVFATRNRLGLTELWQLYLPASLRRADLVVSVPKMKTHHWAGVTCSMKNLFGVMPGICYGWPKNVLHFHNISKSILDINATVRPHLAIVDGIVGMEGDGPIMGIPKPMHVLVMGTNFPAVDATTARLMGIEPQRIAYLAYASGRSGPIAEAHIEQRGEPIAPLAQTFQLLDHPSMDRFRDG